MSLSSVNADLVRAFPSTFRPAAQDAVARFPDPPRGADAVIPLRVGAESVEIPDCIFHDLATIDLTGLGAVTQYLASALLTRHFDDTVRRDHLARIIGSSELWTPPFVMQLATEPVHDILDLIWAHRTGLKAYLYAEFLAANPAFWEDTKQRLLQRGDSVGLRLADHFDTILCSGR